MTLSLTCWWNSDWHVSFFNKKDIKLKSLKQIVLNFFYSYIIFTHLRNLIHLFFLTNLSYVLTTISNKKRVLLLIFLD